DVGAALPDEAFDLRAAVGDRRRGRDHTERKCSDRKSFTHVTSILQRGRSNLCHLVDMSTSVRIAVLAAVTLFAGGCFQSTMLVRIKGDGSGTVETTMLMNRQALAQLRAFAALGNNKDLPPPPDPFSEEEARKQAAAMGPGVRLVSATPIETPD